MIWRPVLLAESSKLKGESSQLVSYFLIAQGLLTLCHRIFLINYFCEKADSFKRCASDDTSTIKELHLNLWQHEKVDYKMCRII